MSEDLIILQFLKAFSDSESWRYWSHSWIISVVIAFVLSVAFELWLFQKRKKKANICIILAAVLMVIFCEYGYQTTPGFDAFIFALAEMVFLSALLDIGCGALIGLILTKIRYL